MNLYLRDQQTKLPEHLVRLKARSVIAYDRNALPEKVTSIAIASKLTLSEIDLGFLFAYDIFPKHIMTSLTQWSQEGRKMEVGDTIVQQIFIPPLRSFSQKIICGVRIKEIINETHRKGFSYETLEGHVEMGISTFTLEQHTQELRFVIGTFSAPATLLSRLLGPVFSRPYQAYCTRQALLHVKLHIEK